MKTINELGIYFMCCFIFATLFITYLAVKLRAYRIKNAKLINRIEIADKDIADAYDALETVKLEMNEVANAHHNLLNVFTQAGKDFDAFRTESAAIINQSAENNAKLVLEIETLKSDRQKLFDIAKGATAKLAEMNVALEGLDSISKPKNKLKIGDYVKGQILAVGGEICGEITEFSSLNNPKVNDWWLKLSTCKRVSKPKNL